MPFRRCALVIAGLVWFDDYMSEGVLQTETQKGNLMVAVGDDPTVSAALLGCSSAFTTATLSADSASGLLAEIPSGTKMHMHMKSWGHGVGDVTIT